MTRVFREQQFIGLHDFGTASKIQDMEFHGCQFSSCVLSQTNEPRLRSKVTNVKLFGCTCDDKFLGPAIVEDVLVDDLSIPGGLHTAGMVFKHVVLRGKFGRVIVAPLYVDLDGTKEEIRAINQANNEYYKNVDWALDIREAHFTDCDLRHIRAHLVRRDPETQAVVHRAKLLDGRWKSLDLGKTHWPTTIQHILDDEEEDRVLVASKRAKNFRHLVKGIELLRDEGIAEPD